MNDFNTLTNILNNYNNVLIMAHKNIDIDAFSSCLAFHEILDSMNIQNKVYFNDENLDIIIKKVLINYTDKDCITDDIDDNYDLLVILDLNRKELLENEEALTKIKDILIIDHHIKGIESIEAKYEFADSKYSSVAEIITLYLKNTGIKLSKDVYTYLLSGIEIDTNGFSVRVSANTFYACAYLLENGADLVIKQELLKENKIEYLKQQIFIKRSFTYNNKYMISVLDDKVYEKKYLATISEELLQFEGIEASFTIGFIDSNVIGISARSIGNIDVEQLMAKLNGGGHKTTAATQFVDSSLEEVKQKLISILGGE